MGKLLHPCTDTLCYRLRLYKAGHFYSSYASPGISWLFVVFVLTCKNYESNMSNSMNTLAFEFKTPCIYR